MGGDSAVRLESGRLTVGPDREGPALIFGGLISSTILDTVLTPVMFYRWGRKPAERLVQQRGAAEY